MGSNITSTPIRPGSRIIRLVQRWPVLVNMYLVPHDDGLILVDTAKPGRAGEVIEAIEAQGKPLKAIAMTHGHRDHSGTVAALAQKPGAPVYAHPEEIPFLTGESYYGKLLGMWSFLGPKQPPERNVPASAIHELHDGEALGPLVARHTPGHTPGHLAFYHAEERAWLVGDVLMNLVGLTGPIRPVTYDMPMVRRSAALFREFPFETLCFGHGPPLVKDAPARLDAYLKRHKVLPAAVSA